MIKTIINYLREGFNELFSLLLKPFMFIFNTHFAHRNDITSKIYVHSSVSNIVFTFGLLLEAFCITITLDKLITPEKILEILKLGPDSVKYVMWGQWVLMGATIIALLIHQNFIRNTFLHIDKVTTKGILNDVVFPKEGLESKPEFIIRFIIFILLATVGGEVLYFIFKVISEFETGWIEENSTKLYVGFTLSLCLAVLIWDYSYKQILKSANTFESNKSTFRDYFWSDLVSAIIWLLVYLLLKFDKNFIIFFIGLFSLVYIVLIVRRISKLKNKNLKAF